MEEMFSLPVLYKGQEFEFPTRLVAFGYTRKFQVMVNEVEITFEKDDENNFRAINHNEASATIAQDLLAAIVASLVQIV